LLYYFKYANITRERLSPNPEGNHQKGVVTMSTETEMFFELQNIGNPPRMVRVIVWPMTRDQARVTFPYRPFSKYCESYFGGNQLLDDVALLLNGLAVRCKMCQAPTKKTYLVVGICPDCDGRTEHDGRSPHEPV
jgi:hypothetical protein